jgi:hypothetical protein
MALTPPKPSEFWNHDEQRIRDFGKAFFVVLAVFGGMAARRATNACHGNYPVGYFQVVWEAAQYWWLTAWAVLTFTNAFPWFTRPLYVVVSVVGMSIGFVLGHAVLALMFFTLIVWIGRMRRPTSPIAKTLDTAAPTYWSAHRPAGSTARYYRQY